MRVHALLCLGLFKLGACIALSMGSERSTHSDKVINRSPVLPGTNESQGLSERAVDSPGEARYSVSWPSRLSYKLADVLNVDPSTTYRFFKVNEATASLDKSDQLYKWLKHVSKFQAKHGLERFSNSQVYDLLSKSRTNDQLLELFLTLSERKKTQQLAARMLLFILNTKEEAFDALLSLKKTPREVFLLLCHPGTAIEVDPFHVWLKYTELYRRKPSNKLGDSVIERHNFFLPITEELMKGRKVEDLVYLFDTIRANSEIANIGGELKTFVEQASSIAIALKEPVPPSPSKFANTVGLVTSMNETFLQWFRYCQEYSIKANGENILLNKMIIRIMKETAERFMKKTASIDDLVLLLQSVREVPELRKFADEMIEAAGQG